MSDATQQRLVTLLASGLTYVLSHLVVSQFVDLPDRRGLKGDVVEALVKSGTSAVASVAASIVVRRLF